MTKQTLEYAPFRLKSGVTEGELMKAAKVIQQEFLAKQPGYLRRELVRREKGYADLIWWSSSETAGAAMAKAEQSAACASYFSLMEMSAADPHGGMQHLELVATFET